MDIIEKTFLTDDDILLIANKFNLDINKIVVVPMNRVISDIAYDGDFLLRCQTRFIDRNKPEDLSFYIFNITNGINYVDKSFIGYMSEFHQSFYTKKDQDVDLSFTINYGFSTDKFLLDHITIASEKINISMCSNFFYECYVNNGIKNIRDNYKFNISSVMSFNFYNTEDIMNSKEILAPFSYSIVKIGNKISVYLKVEDYNEELIIDNPNIKNDLPSLIEFQIVKNFFKFNGEKEIVKNDYFENKNEYLSLIDMIILK